VLFRLENRLFFFLCVELLRPYKWLGLVGSDCLECSYVQLRNWVLIEPSEFFSFWKVAAPSRVDVVGSNQSRFSCAFE
jgi:hypothetical protein